jgi:hypothetical protein
VHESRDLRHEATAIGRGIDAERSSKRRGAAGDRNVFEGNRIGGRCLTLDQHQAHEDGRSSQPAAHKADIIDSASLIRDALPAELSCASAAPTD